MTSNTTQKILYLQIKFIIDTINTLKVGQRLSIAKYMRDNGAELQWHFPNGCSIYADKLSPEVVVQVYKTMVDLCNADLIDYSDIGHPKKEYEYKLVL